MNILIITGHGNGDPGACACGYQEAALVREYAPLLKSKLSEYANVTLFDTSKNMYTYLKAGNSFNFKAYDYVLELHFNAGVNNQQGNGVTTGTEILVHPSESGTGVEQAILKNICSLGFKNRGVKTRTDLLNMNTCKGRQGVSYALLETCFIDDLDDMKLYQEKKSEVINAIAQGIISGFGLAANLSNESEDTLMSAEYEELVKKNEAQDAIINQVGQDIADINAKFEAVPVYDYIDDNMPDWAKPTIQKLVNKGFLQGDENGKLSLTNDLMRILVINDRAGVYGE